MNKSKIFSYVLITTLSASVSSGELYKTIDENGNASFSDKSSEKAVEIELPKNGEMVGAKGVDSLFISIKTDHETHFIERRGDELSFYRETPLHLINFLVDSKNLIKEYSDVIVQFTFSDIPACKLKDYTRASLRELFEDIDQYCAISVSVSPNYVYITRGE